MADIQIVEQDRIDAENFLTEYLQNKTEADYGKGTAIRDLVVTAMAYVVAYFRTEVDNVRKRQSLLLLAEDSGSEVDDAVDEIMSNLFLRRKEGRKSRGVITLYFSEAINVTVTTGALFYKTATLAFLVDSVTDLAYASSEMLPVVSSSGVVTEYALRIPVIANGAGAEYDIEPGIFVNFTYRNPYLTRVENTTKFSGGVGTESTADLMDRAPTALSIRDLNSARSIDVTLKDEFTNVDDVKVVGYGDTEMVRDLIGEEATAIRIHVGGSTDVYLRSPITESEEFIGEINTDFSDNRPGYYSLRDDTVSTFSGVPYNIVRGDIIMVYNNTVSEPARYVVAEASSHIVSVSSRSPFPKSLPIVLGEYDDGVVGPATGSADRLVSTMYTFTSADTGKWLRTKNSGTTNDGTFLIAAVAAIPDNYAVLVDADGLPVTLADETGLDWDLLDRIVEYSIGDNSPTFDNKVSRRLSGRFTKSVQHYGRVLLPFRPIYQIRDVYIEDATDPELSVGGRITFPLRVNDDVLLQPKQNPGDPVYDPAYLKYRVWAHNPTETGSGWQVLEVQVNWDDPAGEENRFDGKQLHVVYDTLTGFDTVWAFMLASDRRITCGSVIPRGLHPVYMSMNIRYKIAKTATDTLDETEAAAALAAHINNFDTKLDFDVSDVAAFLRTTYDSIGYIEPVTINYELLSPDGRVIYYQTTDTVEVIPSKYHPSHLGSAEDHLDDPLVYGVSDDTLRYLTVPDLITFEAL